VGVEKVGVEWEVGVKGKAVEEVGEVGGARSEFKTKDVASLVLKGNFKLWRCLF
jgi:hypothetical protein